MNNRMVFLAFINSILITLIINTGLLNAQTSDPEIKIHYLGHSAFVLQFDNGINIVTDYGKENAWVAWGWNSPINDIGDLVPDVMTYSHHHEDHYDPSRIPQGVTHILSGLDNLSIEGIEIKPVRTCETNVNVESNTSFIFEYKGLKICHLGDAQAQIMNINTTEVRDKILTNFPNQFDLLFMTIDGQQHFISESEAFVDLLKPKRIIPMHHWSENYLQEFISYLEDQNSAGKNYQINEAGNAQYDLFVSENEDPVQVISLSRAPFTTLATVAIDNEIILEIFDLQQNHPNPFNPTTTIEYNLPISEEINVSVYNILGNKVRELYDGQQFAGTHNISFSANDLPSGFYYYKLESDNICQMKKCLLLK